MDKVRQIWESRKDTAAKTAASELHVTGLKPRITGVVIKLHVGGVHVAIAASSNKQLVFNHPDAKVAMGRSHGGHFLPGVGPWIVDLCAFQTVVAVQATNLQSKRRI